MNFKRGEIYVKDYGDPFLVLATSKIGVTVLFIGKGNLWEQIPGIEDHHKRRWFSEIEVIAISCMPTDAVADKYSINYSQACYIIRNAKDIIGMYRTRTTKKYTYAKYFEQGFTAEEVAEIYPDKKCLVHQCYEQWWLNNKNVTEESQSAAIEKWKIPVTFMSELELANYVYHVNVYDFCRSEKCRTSVGGRLLRDIKRKQLAKNPLAVVGFNELAFGADLQTQYILNCRLALNEKGSASQTQIVDTIIYDEVIKVAKYYDKSFSKHADILSSIEQIPSDIPAEDVPTYLMLIRNRFNLDATNLTDEEIDYIGFETYENIAKRFLF